MYTSVIRTLLGFSWNSWELEQTLAARLRRSGVSGLRISSEGNVWIPLKPLKDSQRILKQWRQLLRNQEALKSSREETQRPPKNTEL